MLCRLLFRWRARRLLLGLIVALLTVLLAGVAAAQSSPGFDLACRGTVNAAGTVHLYSNSLGLVDAVGQTAAGIQVAPSGSFGLHAGYLQPFAGQRSAAQLDALPTGPAADGFNHFFPLVHRFVRIVRGCTF